MSDALAPRRLTWQSEQSVGLLDAANMDFRELLKDRAIREFAALAAKEGCRIVGEPQFRVIFVATASAVPAEENESA